MSADSAIAPRDLRVRLAQLVMVRIGSNLPPIVRAHDDMARISAVLDECPVGGLLLFNGEWPATRDAIAQLQAKSRTPLLIAADVERGAGQQVAGLTAFPHQRAFVDLPDATSALGHFARITAAEVKAVGVHVTFGPVADVNSDPRNPIIATRAFGDDPQRAAELVTIYTRAMEKEGLASCAKHFPGHGDTHQDSHDTTPRVDVDLSTLEARELTPFAAAIGAGVSLVMTAHVAFPALDPSGTPATLSKPILTDHLRGRMGFDGVICTDSLLMAGVRARFETEGAMCVAAIAAGIDLLLDVKDPAHVVDALHDAVSEGRLDEARVEDAFQRVWRLKSRFFDASPSGEIDLESSAQTAKRVAQDAIAIVSGPAAEEIAFSTAASLTAVLLRPNVSYTEGVEEPLEKTLRERFAAVRYFESGLEVEPSLGDDILAGAPADERLLVAMIVKPAAWHAFGLSDQQAELVRRLCGERQVVLACLGVENALDPFDNAAAKVVAHSDALPSQVALVDFLARDS